MSSTPRAFYLFGLELGYSNGAFIEEKGFQFKNPNAETSCGRGTPSGIFSRLQLFLRWSVMRAGRPSGSCFSESRRPVDYALAWYVTARGYL